MLLAELEEFLFCIFLICRIIILFFRANEICKSKGKSKITVKDVIEAMEKSGFGNFQPEIENLMIEIDKFNPKKESKKRKNENDLLKPE